MLTEEDVDCSFLEGIIKKSVNSIGVLGNTD